MQLPKGATLNEYPPEVQAQLARKPLWPPPAGVKSNFVNPEDRRVLQISITTIFLVIALLFFFNRVYVKLVLTKRKTWDDALLLIAVLLGVAHYCISTWGTEHLQNRRR
ncbi:hypothetical protein BDV95DRAFT_579923 [Massariosphaeria phaeospora]|uniref:Uncharacterized protein n=1 Tax=Massariosphaeria phaeospora TaxID=100035 RepID=A0A7C8I1P0_9PLEO|nr:hypothetical protein BDV95DRAFT_579923 [Massariosphaeria phaeospora]